MPAAAEVDGHQDEKLWTKILSETRAKGTVSTDDQTARNIVVLGDHGSGKRTLLAQMQRKDKAELSKGLGLEYTFLEIPESREDVPKRINIWNLAGEVSNADLLDFCLNKDTIDQTAVVITIDYSTPWGLLQQLTRWMGVFETRMQVLHKTMEKSKVQAMKSALETSLQTYNSKQKELKAQQGEKASGEEGGATEDTNTPKSAGSTEEPVLLPLPEGVLTDNYGVPILIACCKCDAIRQLEKDLEFKDTHFDFIQQHLRKFSLKYGAALMYTSAKDDRHTALALDYIQSALWGTPCTTQPEVLDKAAIFIPAGWDSKQKIAVVADTLTASNIDPDQAFDMFITEPKSRSSKKTAKVAAPVKAEDEQEFLKKHLAHLEKSVKYTAPQKGNASTFSSDSTSTRTSQRATGGQSKARAGAAGTGAGGALPQQGDLEAAKDFFDTLLKKGPSRGGVGTPDDKVRSDARKAIANFKGDDKKGKGGK